MKQKKQRKKLIQGLGIALGVALLGVGLWSGINEEKLQARPQETKLTKDSLEPKVAGWPFLSEGATIPAENSLVFTGQATGEPDMSKIRTSEGIDKFTYGQNAMYKLSPEPQWVEQDDVGYYQGEKIGLRITIQLIDPPSSVPTDPLPGGYLPSMGDAWIGYGGGNFASVSVPSWLPNGLNATYEVYKVNDPARKPIPFSGYFPLAPSYESTRISVLNWSQIVASGSHIYSVSATSTPNTQLQYQLDENVLTLARNSTDASGVANAVFTFSNQSSLRFRLFPVFEDNTPWKANDALAYKPSVSMRIAIPDPEPIEVPDVKEIKADTEMDYQFNQQIPPEPASKRDQRVQWTLKTDDNKTVVPDVDAAGTLKSWTVADLDGNDMTSKFEVTSFNESTNEVTIAPKEAQYTEDSFYNHYYTFKSKLKIDYTKPIDEKLLKERDGGKYLDKTGTVTLAVNGVAREEQEFKTSINFASTAYLVQGTSTAVPGFTPTAAQKTGEGIITHAAALTPPSPIGTANKYHYASVEPANKIIKYSTQDMKFYYVEDAEPWLPYYKPGQGLNNGGWLDSVTSYIPKENAFSIRYMEGKTKVTKVSDGVWFDPSNQTVTQTPDGWDWTSRYHTEENPDGDIDENTMVPINFSDSPTQSLEFANVAYYNGENIGLKVTLTQINPVTPQPTNPTYKYGPAIGVKPFLFGTEEVQAKTFLIFYTNFELAESYQIEYEFLDTTGNPLSVGSNFTTTGVYKNKEFKIKSDSFKNIYSLPRSSDLPVLEKAPVELQYEELANNWLSIIGTNVVEISPYLVDARGEFTTTFNGSKYLIQTRPTNSSKGFAVYYGSKGLVKTEIPDPQATSQTYTEIIGAGTGITDNQMIDPLNYGFIQQMPWESQSPKDNRTQIPTWTLPAPIGSETFTQSENWQVQSLDDPDLGGGDVYGWFTAIGDDLTPKGGLTGQLAEDDFYNHYYKFNRSLAINYSKPIARTSLNPKENGPDGYYYDYSGEVKLDVEDDDATDEQKAGMNKNRKEVKYDTAINFYAPLVYQYVNSVTGAAIPADSLPDSAKPTGDGIVTWDAPLTPQVLTDAEYTQTTGQGEAPVIDGYQFDRSELNGSEEDKQIQVTKLLREKTATEETVDADDPANYTQNNVVTLYYTPVSYDVAIEVTKPNGDTLEANANPYFELSNDDGVTWTPVSGYDFAAGNTYQIRQKEAVSLYYNPAGTSPTFTVTVNEDGDFELTVTDDDTYSFIRTELTDDKKLIIKVINQPSGGIVLSKVAPLDYGTVQVPRKDRTIKRVDPDWTINFEDNRPPETENQLHFYVTLTKEFTDQDGAGTRTLPSILAFIDEPGEITANDFLVKDAQVPIQTIELPQYGADSLTWSADAGFLLQLDKKAEAKLNVGQDQKYRAELTFTLAADPL